MLRSQILMKLEFPGHIFEKYSIIKFEEIPSSGSRVLPCGQTDGQTTKITVAFLNFAKEKYAISIFCVH